MKLPLLSGPGLVGESVFDSHTCTLAMRVVYLNSY